MGASNERPMSGSMFLLLTVLMVLGALFLLRWIFSTVTFLFNSLLLIAVLGGAAYLYLKARGSKS